MGGFRAQGLSGLGPRVLFRLFCFCFLAAGGGGGGGWLWRGPDSLGLFGFFLGGGDRGFGMGCLWVWAQARTISV